jgi:hypothetical protein
LWSVACPLAHVNISRVLNPNRSRNAQIESS